MKYVKHTLAALAVATFGLTSVAEARDHGWRGGRHQQHSPIERRAHPQEFGNYVDRRQATQRARIRNGRHQGQLTRRELRWLRDGQQRIAGIERRFGADGHYSHAERRSLVRALDRASYRIKGAKHNPRRYRYHTQYRRWDNWGPHGLSGHDGPRHSHRPRHRGGYSYGLDLLLDNAHLSWNEWGKH